MRYRQGATQQADYANMHRADADCAIVAPIGAVRVTIEGSDDSAIVDRDYASALGSHPDIALI